MLRVAVSLCLLGLVLCIPPVTKSRKQIEAFTKYLLNSKTDNGVLLSSRMLENPHASIWENSGKYQGDIMLDDWQVEALVQDFAAGRNAYTWPNTKWPRNEVIYEFGANEFNAEQEQAIRNAMAKIEHYTCARFRRRQPGEYNYVLITGRPDGCYANVGFWNGRGVHIYNVARSRPGSGCFVETILIHEWLHVLGFFHMQSTYSRDNYVRINLDNIIAGTEFNFDKYDSGLVSNLGLPYEYTSIMHYDSHAFSKNGRPTIEALRDFQGTMGQIEYVTRYDWLRVDRHYNCPGAWSDNVADEIKNVEEVAIEKNSEEINKVSFVNFVEN